MTKLSLTRTERKKLGKLKNLNDGRTPLSAKEVKHYRKLVEAKLEAMGVSDQTVMVTTNKTKWMYYIDRITRKPTRAQVPVHRLSNFKKNLVKKLMQLSVKEVEVFLAQEIKTPPKQEVQIQGAENVAST